MRTLSRVLKLPRDGSRRAEPAGTHAMTTSFRTLSKFPEPGTLAAARALLLELAPTTGAVPFDSWTSLATICDTGWLPAARRPSAALARVTRRRLRVLATPPLSFAAFARLPAGEGPVHLQGTCAALSGGGGSAPLWSVETVVAADGSRQLAEQGNDFLLSLPGGDGSRAGRRRPPGQRRRSTNRRRRVGVRLRRRDRRPQRPGAVGARSGRARARAALRLRAAAAGVSAAWAHDRRGTLKRQHGPR